MASKSARDPTVMPDTLALRFRLGHDFPRILERSGVFEDAAHEEGHGRAVPISLATTAHFAHGNLRVVHAADRADEAGVANVDGCFLARLVRDEIALDVLEANMGHVIQHTAMEQLSADGRIAAERETGAMKELGKNVGEFDFVVGYAGAFREALKFFKILRVGVQLQPAPRIADGIEKPFAFPD